MALEKLQVNSYIESCLQKLGICQRCMIRLTTKNLNFELLNELPLKDDDDWCCYLCSGLLQKATVVTDILNKVSEAVSNSGFSFSSFQLTVSTPAHFALRECAAFTSLQKNINDSICHMDIDNLDDISSIKSVWKWQVKTLLAKQLGKTYIDGQAAQTLRGETDDTVVVNVFLEQSPTEEEAAAFINMSNEQQKSYVKRRRHNDMSRRTIVGLLGTIPMTILNAHLTPRQPPTVSVTVHRLQQVCIGGRYRKLSRRLPQSPWVFDGERRLPGSVQETIADDIVTATRAQSYTFVSAGREDVDVRMLGEGRPFVLELTDCRKTVAEIEGILPAMQALIGGDVEIGGYLRIVPPAAVQLIKAGEEHKAKRYRAVVWCQDGLSCEDSQLEAISMTKDLLVYQQTPIRVLHRRALIERPKLFHSFSAQRLSVVLSNGAVDRDPSLSDYKRFLEQYDANHLFVVELRCQAGSYVKEFVHGDLGRTQPNLATIIGQQCDILALDVMEIELDWPPVDTIMINK